MKKKMLKFLTGILVSCALAGSAVAVHAEGDLVDMVANDGTGTEGNMVKSYLTGENVPESIGRRRPIAFMMGNDINGAPQSGIGNAGVVYEAPVEGGITRLMSIIEDYDSLEKIGSIRSCRDYYLYYANEFNAIYSHYGQAAYALPFLDQHVIDNLNGLNLGNTYFRTSDRQAPHNAYTNASYLAQGIASLGYSQSYKPEYTGHYVFAADGTETTLDAGTAANVVHLDNFSDNHPWFEYNAETKKYSRFQFGGAHVDELTGQQLTCDNIILQYSAYQPYDQNGYLNVDTISGGQGKFITRGKAVDIRWEKDAVWGVTHYYDANEQEIQLNPGKTWVEIVQNDKIGSVTYQ
ncbi:DUF3048 domain-containing protein [Ruminococcus sp. 5_1_39BFAA]|uniref:DUF3048 domain-containing protein n=1 Tax=Ruminococcus sp. 5_1_39BFAA TaxID=457412 RepID=UPI003562B601